MERETISNGLFIQKEVSEWKAQKKSTRKLNLYVSMLMEVFLNRNWNACINFET